MAEYNGDIVRLYGWLDEPTKPNEIYTDEYPCISLVYKNGNGDCVVDTLNTETGRGDHDIFTRSEVEHLVYLLQLYLKDTK